MIGKTLSHYRVVEKLGGSDTGVVHRGTRHLPEPRPFLGKILMKPLRTMVSILPASSARLKCWAP